MQPVPATEACREGKQRHCSDQLERSQRKVAKEIVIADALVEIDTMLQQELADDACDSEAADFIAIARVHRNVVDDCTKRVEAEQHVGFKK